jgi:hypothetical protein
VGLPKAFVIDLKQRTMRGTPDSLVRRLAPFERITRTPATLVLQGVDEGISGPGTVFGWNLAIDTATARLCFPPPAAASPMSPSAPVRRPPLMGYRATLSCVVVLSVYIQPKLSDSPFSKTVDR